MNQEELSIIHEYITISMKTETHDAILSKMGIANAAFGSAYNALNSELHCVACENTGWLHSVDGITSIKLIQRCDNCQMITSDAAATILHRRMCNCGWEVEKSDPIIKKK